METNPDISSLMTQIAELYLPLSPSFQVARWKQIQLLAEKHTGKETIAYADEVVYPLAACIYFAHYLAIVPDHNSAWNDIAQIALSEVRRLSVD